MIMCEYIFELPLDPLPLMQMTSQTIIENGGTVTGQLPRLSISIPTPLGRFDGVCTLVSASAISISVTRKPEIVSYSMIRDRLTSYLTEAVKMQARLAQDREASGVEFR
jgi:hypothetical protein